MQKVCHFFVSFPLDTHTGRRQNTHTQPLLNSPGLIKKGFENKGIENITITYPEAMDQQYTLIPLTVMQKLCFFKGNYSTVTYIGEAGGSGEIIHLGHCSIVTGGRNTLPTSLGF